MTTPHLLQQHLDRLATDGASVTPVGPTLWRVREHGGTGFDVLIALAPPVALLRAKVMDRPTDPATDARLSARLLELNATELLHGAYGYAADGVVLTDTLELEHLDYEELRASFESLTLALGTQIGELVGIVTGAVTSAGPGAPPVQAGGPGADTVGATRAPSSSDPAGPTAPAPTSALRS